VNLLTTTEEKSSIENPRIRLSGRYKYVIMPIDPTVLIEKLGQAGFSLPSRLPRPPAGAGISYQPVGSIGQRGQDTVDLDLGKGIVAIEGVDSVDVVKDFKSVEQILSKEFLVDVEKRTWFLECIAEMSLKGRKSPTETTQNLFPESKLFQQVGQQMGVSVAPFGLRLASKNSLPLDEDWFDFKLEPLVHNPRAYYVSIVYRSANRSKVYDFLSGLEAKVEDVLRTVELSGSRPSH